MRIIGGLAGGRRLHVPKGCPIRPTSDRIKEALFNILHSVDGKAFLDLYAGIGNVGLEALSRGASRVVFVERNISLAEAIKKNATTCGFEDHCEIIVADVKQGVQRLAERRERFHIIFADPPYDRGFVGETLKCLEDGRLFADDALFVLQHSRRETVVELERGLFELMDQRRYGDTAISLINIQERD